MTIYYGHHKETSYPVAARVWGHRLRAGQNWMEYMLEFLSIVSGFDYRFGQGLPEHRGEGYLSSYSIPRRLGLRRFVFYDEREKTRDDRDTRATAELHAHLHTLLAEQHKGDSDLLEQVRSLLRSFSVIEKDRSWYAKSLFPVHEEFLLWEALRKGSTKRTFVGNVDDRTLEELDQGLEFRARNFFARGGELYYLMISAGTEGDPERRTRISQRLQQLLRESNRALGQLARTIDTTWSELINEQNGHITGDLGWIPDPACALYRQIAADLDTFLDNNLDSLECLEALAHLIGFHMISYIYHRAHAASHPEGHASGSCLEACRPALLVDLLGDQDGGIIRKCSANLLREQHDRQIRQAQAFITDQVRTWVAEAPTDGDLLADYVDDEVKNYFGTKTRTKTKVMKALRDAKIIYNANGNGTESVIETYAVATFEGLSADFRKNFLGIHRGIGGSIGFVAPQKGSQMRYVLGDTLLKTLVMAVLPPDEGPLRFGTFLERLYARYGIIVGPGEAHAAQLVDRLRINEEYYTRNREALRARMQRAGLITQYSDATALVRRR